jgi:hypothetical protein
MLFRKKKKETLEDMIVVAGKFKPMKNTKIRKDGASIVAKDEDGRKSLTMGCCPWMQQSLTRLHQSRNSFKEVLEIRPCDLDYLLAHPSPNKPKKESLSIIKKRLMHCHSEKDSGMADSKVRLDGLVAMLVSLGCMPRRQSSTITFLKWMQEISLRFHTKHN